MTYTTQELRDHVSDKRERKPDLIKRLYPPHIAEVDYALPLGWVNSVAAICVHLTRREIVDCFVWGWLDAGPFTGQPLPLNMLGVEILERLDRA